jgi:membrane-associated HD superfamily phosphohydrolase
MRLDKYLSNLNLGTRKNIKEHIKNGAATINKETISNLVDSIIDNLIEEKQFIYTNLTFNDITVIRESLKIRISDIYHARIEYPK